MASNRPLSDRALVNILENWSRIDSQEDDQPFVLSPQVVITEIPNDDFIDRRLQNIFGGSSQNNDDAVNVMTVLEE